MHVRCRGISSPVTSSGPGIRTSGDTRHSLDLGGSEPRYGVDPVIPSHPEYGRLRGAWRRDFQQSGGRPLLLGRERGNDVCFNATSKGDMAAGYGSQASGQIGTRISPFIGP